MTRTPPPGLTDPVRTTGASDLRLVSLDDLPEALGSLRLLRVELALVAREDARLPRFLGSTLRGGLARATQRVTCAFRDQECSSCRLRERCAYLLLFETPRPEGSTVLRGQRAVPRPLLIDPPPLREEPWAAGEELIFGLTLFGRAIDHLPRLVAAAADAAERGLGAKRHPFELLGVAWRRLADGAAIPILEPGRALDVPPPERLGLLLADRSPEERATLELLTPTRLVEKGALTCEPSPRVIVRALATRALALLHFHDGAMLDLDIAASVDAASKLEVPRRDLRLVKLTRLSSRQGRPVPLDGMVGQMDLAGETLRDLWPLFVAGETIRLGKGTIFGLGRYSIS